MLDFPLFCWVFQCSSVNSVNLCSEPLGCLLDAFKADFLTILLVRFLEGFLNSPLGGIHERLLEIQEERFLAYKISGFSTHARQKTFCKKMLDESPSMSYI